MRIALDFDGVIHSYKQGFTGAVDLPGAPVEGAREFITAAQTAGHEVVVFSCRARTPAQAKTVDPWIAAWDTGGYNAILAWLAKYKFPPLVVTGVKPIADIYMDDYGWRFDGRWPTLEYLANLVPWYHDKSRAMRGLGTGSHARPQEVLTPAKITDFVRELFDNAISLDPCAANDARETVRALERWDGSPGQSGLDIAWMDRTFCNPPYGTLMKWLRKARNEAVPYGSDDDFRDRIVVLCPVRSRSAWWREARNIARCDGAYIELDRVTFIGYESSFPESLCLMCFNCNRERAVALLEKHPIGGIA